MISAVLTVPVAILLLTATDLYTAYAWNFVFQLFSPLWIGSGVALVNELVLPRMRATSSAFYILAVTFIGLALGPYSVGQISDALVQSSGYSAGEALRTAMLLSLVAYVWVLFFLWLASRHVEQEEKGRMERARDAGEPV